MFTQLHRISYKVVSKTYSNKLELINFQQNMKEKLYLKYFKVNFTKEVVRLYCRISSRLKKEKMFKRNKSKIV